MKNKLIFSALRFIRMTFDVDLRRRMRDLWVRKTVTTGWTLGDYYKSAFVRYLHNHKVPKQMERITRTTARLNVDGETVQMLVDLGRIAKRRQQPLAVIIEESLDEFLSLPENYLGKDRESKTRLVRIK